MSDTAVLVESFSVGASQRLLKYSQVHIHTVALLLVALLHSIRDAALALLATISASAAAARISARQSVVVLKQNGAALLPAGSCTFSELQPDSSESAVTDNSSGRHCQQAQHSLATANTLHSTASAQQCLIPRQLPRHRGRLTVVLDLDETLLCTYRLQADQDAVRLVPSNTAAHCSNIASSNDRRQSLTSLYTSSGTGRRSSSSSGSASGGYQVTTSKPSAGQLALLGAEYGASCWMTFTPVNGGAAAATTLAVFERPGCRQFLSELSKFAECVLFTAASAAYARPLANLLDPDNSLFRARLFSDSCSCVCGREGVKDLSGFGRDLSRVVLVDNSPYSFMLQPSNGLPCMPFHGHSADKQLLGVILPLLQSLSQLPDIRPLLSSKFKVKEWLRSKGCSIPAAKH